MFLRVSKYPSSAIFRNAIINAQRANVTGSTSPRPPIYVAQSRTSLARCLHPTSCERSELSSLFNARIFYIIISGRTSCRKCSKCFYVYLNIRPVRYSARIESVANARRQHLRTARQLRTVQSPKERDARLQQLRTAREQTIATESTEERQTRLQQLRSAQQQRIAAETPEEIEARLQQLSTAQHSATGLLMNGQRGERPGVNGLPLSHRRKETPVFNKLQLLVNRRLRQNRLRGPS